jgi:hypothetical protein
MNSAKRFFFALVLSIFCISKALALEVTSIKITGRKDDSFTATLELSQVIEITDVEFSKNTDGQWSFKLPLTRSGEKSYANIFVQSKNLYERICKSAAGAFAKNKTKPPVLTFLSARKLDSSYRIANVNVSFDGELAVTFGLLRSEGFFRVVSPHITYKASYPGNLKVKDSNLKRKIDSIVIREGQKAN